ncbi:MAG: glycosyltransferase family 2 protein [Acidobacteriaceae bacterium]
MFLSLVVCTVDRADVLSRLFESLALQSNKDFEVILVDQNPNGDLLRKAEEWNANGLRVVHMRSERGLSHSRNQGLARVKGQYIAFPDDDCWYPSTLVADVTAKLRSNPQWAGITGRTISPDGADTCGRWLLNEGEMSRKTVWNQANSTSMFLRRDLVEKVGYFDESLGLGAKTPWLAAEETDYLVRALDAGYRIQYCPDIRIFHPKTERGTPASLMKARLYGRGTGRVLSKQQFGLATFSIFCLRPLAGATLKAISGDLRNARFHFQSFLGRLEGYLVSLPLRESSSSGSILQNPNDR